MKKPDRLTSMMRGILAFLLIWTAVAIIIPSLSWAALGADEFKQYLDSITQPIGEIVPSVSWQVLAKADPDECFYRVGDSRNTFDPGLELPCPEPATAKVNQAYVWGMAKSEDNLWYGDLAIHEWAHGCGWNHDGGGGVPLQNGFVAYSINYITEINKPFSMNMLCSNKKSRHSKKSDKKFDPEY